MVTSRSKRSTAGNRLKALLDQELEKDEIFAEVENDVDFEANDNEAVDIVDSDFDRDSDEDRPAQDESEGEREIERQEKEDKRRRRAQARTVGVVKRPFTATAIAQKTPNSAGAEEPKKRRISFAPDHTSSPGTIDAAKRRSSARAATVQSKREVESRLEEASQRRAAQPFKHVVKKKASLTQDALIAEALEVEEENRESLRRFLEQEEERRAKQRQRKERITGPFVRWMSVGFKTKVVEEIRAADQASGGAADTGGQQANAAAVAEHPRSASSVHSAEGEKCEESGAGADVPDSQVAISIPAPLQASADIQNRDTDAGPLAKAALSGTMGTNSLASASASTAESLTLDPVIAARQQAALLRSCTNTHDASTSTSAEATTSGIRFELQARTLLSIERMPEDWEWLDEHNALFGTHCAWDAYPFVPSRNRPLRPRQSICPITGLPAIYKDPRTGIAYGSKHAYAVITRLLHAKWLWTGGHYQDSPQIMEPKPKSKIKHLASIPAGAVPPQSGIYLDDEDERGATDIWLTARATLPAPNPTHPPTHPFPSARTSEPSACTTTTTPSKLTDKRRSKPHFEVVLTNALAPGDEKAVLAAALELPAGSTRSGRRGRVQRS